MRYCQRFLLLGTPAATKMPRKIKMRLVVPMVVIVLSTIATNASRRALNTRLQWRGRGTSKEQKPPKPVTSRLWSRRGEEAKDPLAVCLLHHGFPLIFDALQPYRLRKNLPGACFVVKRTTMDSRVPWPDQGPKDVVQRRATETPKPPCCLL